MALLYQMARPAASRDCSETHGSARVGRGRSLGRIVNYPLTSTRRTGPNALEAMSLSHQQAR